MIEDPTWLKAAVVIALSLLFQETVLTQVVILGAHPDLMIVLPVTAGIVAGAEVGSVVGFFAGAAADLLLSTPFGLSAFVFALVGYGIGAFVNSPLGHDLYNARLSGSGLGSVVGTLVFAVVASIIGQPGSFSVHLLATFFNVGIGALVFAPVLFVGWRWALSSIRTLGFGPRMPTSGSALNRSSS